MCDPLEPATELVWFWEAFATFRASQTSPWVASRARLVYLVLVGLVGFAGLAGSIDSAIGSGAVVTSLGTITGWSEGSGVVFLLKKFMSDWGR